MPFLAETMENENVKILKDEVLSNNWYVLRKLTFQYRLKDGSWLQQVREAYDRGNGATILLYNKVAEDGDSNPSIPPTNVY